MSHVEIVSQGKLDELKHSVSLEKMLETVFLAELVQEAWFARGLVVDIMHSAVDAFGHDVVLECEDVIRHVQLKTRRKGGKQSRVKLNTQLARRPSGCVVWMEWGLNSATQRIELDYRWFGGSPGAPLPPLGDKLAKHAKGDATGKKKARLDIRIVNLGAFTRLHSIADVVDSLFVK